MSSLWTGGLLYHLTWDCRVESILFRGLVPSYEPNKWVVRQAVERSVGKLFLCEASRKGFWYDIYSGDYAGWPNPAASLVWLRVDPSGLLLTPDVANNGVDDYAGDYWTADTIPPERIHVIGSADNLS
jgi:hypothetical protein